jgi:hypothetical protein
MARGVDGWRKRCSAHRSNGDPCRAPAIRGGNVCVTHGGAANHVKQSARARLDAMIDPALDELRKLISSADSDSVKLSAIKDVLDRCGYKIPEKIDLAGRQVIEIEYVQHPLPASNGHVLAEPWRG